MIDQLLGDEKSNARRLVSQKSYREKEVNQTLFTARSLAPLISLTLYPRLRLLALKIDRVDRLISSAASVAPPSVVLHIKKIVPLLSRCVVFCEAGLPICANVWVAAAKAFYLLPLDLMYVALGLLLCFFGGFYPATMAALEAWRQAGGKEALGHLRDLWVEAKAVAEAECLDDLRDDDGDGVLDVEILDSRALVLRKARVAVLATHPDKVNGAVTGIYSGWVGVIAVLKIQFAKVIALGAAMGDFLVRTVERPATACLVHLVQPEGHKWIPTIISVTCKVISISVAWHIQIILSAFHSSVRGGLMAARGFIQ